MDNVLSISKMKFAISILVLAVLQEASAFRAFIHHKPTFLSLRMAEDPMAAIKAKMAADPNYDPMKDPEAISKIESMIPSELRDLSNAVARLEVAFKDATTGVDAVDNLDKRAAEFPNKNELISSPNSQWFKAGQPADNVPFSSSKKDAAFEKLRQEYPEVPVSP